jgi:hypothetical protein
MSHEKQPEEKPLWYLAVLAALCGVILAEIVEYFFNR